MGATLVNSGVLVLALSLLLILVAICIRHSRGFTAGKTIALDSVTITSKTLGLVGRPDRIVQQGRKLIVEEWKGRPVRVYPSHRAQLGVYFLLVEEHYGVKVDHGVVVLRDGRRERVENSPELRELVLGVADQIRAARRDVEAEIPVAPERSVCRGCGQRSRCAQSKA